MDPKIQILAILEHMRYLLSPVDPKFSYWKRRVNAALVNEQELIKLLSGTFDGVFHD